MDRCSAGKAFFVFSIRTERRSFGFLRRPIRARASSRSRAVVKVAGGTDRSTLRFLGLVGPSKATLASRARSRVESPR